MVVSPSFRRVREKGFTLLEVLLALMIATLAIFSLIQFTNQQNARLQAAGEAQFLAVITKACQDYISGNYAVLSTRGSLSQVGGREVVDIFGSQAGSVQGEGYIPSGIADAPTSGGYVLSPLKQRYQLVIRNVGTRDSGAFAFEGMVVAATGSEPLAEDILSQIALLGGAALGYVELLGVGGRPAGSITSPSGSWFFPRGSWGQLEEGHPVGYAALVGTSSTTLSGPWLARKFTGDPELNSMSTDLDMRDTSGKMHNINNVDTIKTDYIGPASGSRINVLPGTDVRMYGGALYLAKRDAAQGRYSSTRESLLLAGTLTLKDWDNPSGGQLHLSSSSTLVELSVHDMSHRWPGDITNDGGFNLITLGRRNVFSVFGCKLADKMVPYPSALYRLDGTCFGNEKEGYEGLMFFYGDIVTSNHVQSWGNMYAHGFVSTSDRRLKTDIDPISPVESLSNILSLKPVSFRWKDSARMKGDNGRKHLGFVAQDVENIIPELVTGGEGQSNKNLDYSGLVAPVVGAVQELYARFRTFTQTLQKKLNNMAALIGKNTQNIEAIRRELITVRNRYTEDIKGQLSRIKKENAQLRSDIRELRKLLSESRSSRGPADGGRLARQSG